MQLEAENWRLCSTTAVRGASGHVATFVATEPTQPPVVPPRPAGATGSPDPCFPLRVLAGTALNFHLQMPSRFNTPLWAADLVAGKIQPSTLL